MHGVSFLRELPLIVETAPGSPAFSSQHGRHELQMHVLLKE